MASFTDKITVVIDVATEKATRGVKDFKTAVKDAEGFTGKFKAGVGSLRDAFMSGGGLTAAVGAAGGAALIAVDKFAKLGVEVGEVSDATGLSADEASRWIEVAGDLGIEADTLKGTIGKLNKTIDPKRFADLGIEISRTKDGAVDVNGTFLNVIDRLNGMRDPAEKARVASELLGRGWQSMAELIGQGSDKLEDSLGKVSDAKVIDQSEVEKARKYRKAMDDLNDVVQDLAIQVGEKLAPAIADAAENIANMAQDVEPALGPLGELNGWFSKIQDFNPSNPVRFFDTLKGIVINSKAPTEELAETTVVLGDANKEAAQQAKALEDQERKLADTHRATRDAVSELEGAYGDLIGRLNEEDAWANLNEKLWAAKDGVGDLDQDTRDYTRALADMVTQMDEIPSQVKTSLITKLDRGALDEVQSYLNGLRNGIVVPLYPKGVDGKKRASGGQVRAGVPYLVGEQGPEMIVPGSNGNVLNAGATRMAAAGGGDVHIHVQGLIVGSKYELGKAVKDALTAFERRSG